ncbi:MAG: hypothetical protein B7Z15_15095 [Rhizobiales bacterium 32-66-8]|nr:MAG: hypothetical protein B7Z15_15095 [Rhizobiales bacterium 32-66-8]
MTFSPGDLLLLAALIATTVCVVMVYRRLKRLDTLNADYERALAQASTALNTARDALTTLNHDGREVLVLLAGRIDVAHDLIAELDARTAAPAPRRAPESGARATNHTRDVSTLRRG